MSYTWKYMNAGGATRVKISSGEDIRHLGELDQKQWTVLSCPVEGLELDAESLRTIDLDNDGNIHATEVIKAAEWLCSVLWNPNVLLDGKAELALNNIVDETILAVATEVAAGAETVSLSQVESVLANLAVPEQVLPDAPFSDEIASALESCRDSYSSFFRQRRLQQAGLANVADDVVQPGISEVEFTEMLAKQDAYRTEVEQVNKANADALQQARDKYMPLRKLLLLARDFYTLLRNFITLEDFYDFSKKAIFQAGTLYIDQRACTLCMRVQDMAKHNAQAAASGIFLVYCQCVNKKLGQQMQIVAAVTVGDIRNLTVGKNGIFYDRAGNDWDATITNVIDNPISIGQAFWSPYRKLAQWIQDLVQKKAAEKEQKNFDESTQKLQISFDKTTGEQNLDRAKTGAFDVAKFAGIFAALGMGLGMIGSALSRIVSGVNGMPLWKTAIWIAVLLLVISGPSMLIAWFKLRKRNIAPLLNANGWAVNAESIVNVIFGATLTNQAQFPLLKMLNAKSKENLKKGADKLKNVNKVIHENTQAES